MRPLKSPTGEGGFTLLELLVTLTLATLLIGVVVPALSDRVAHARLMTSADYLAIALRETRATAMQTSQPTALAIDRAGTGYSTRGRGFVVPPGQVLIFKPSRQARDDTVSAVTFLPDGSSNGGTIVVARGRDQVAVEIDWLSGRITRRE